ncbi:trimeric intracellular cation channel family protein [Streptomyces flavofungini]|uniref:trimeric intracellular cation channel family protein n=1 Tax=Streptomyces flavofungini TaxID=68200 RepID=UPI0019B0A995|nr:trimeric intracellular cation channel family protein [Streptomyces flavofungini]GHC50845.1 membrane protein [Streptomyces flavofungini]
MLHTLYLVGIAAFAASGVLAAHRARMDPFGGLVLAFVASISGGTLRDLILDRHPLYWTHDWVLLTVVACTGVATMLFLRHRELPQRTLMVVDAVGLAVVTVMGAQAAIDAGVTPLAVVLLAVLTGVTGEVVRDVLCGQFPPLLLREEVYATAALAGALCYLGLHHAGASPTATTVTSAGLVLALRLAAITKSLHLPPLSRADNTGNTDSTANTDASPAPVRNPVAPPEPPC